MRRILLATLVALVALPSAARADDKKEEKVTFKDHVLPIFRARCGSCHNANDRSGGLVLDDYAVLMEGGSSGEVVEPGDADASYLWLLVTHESEPKMPPNADKLPAAELETIKKWINGGLLATADSKAKMSDKPKLAKIEIQPGQRPAEVAMPVAYLGDTKLVASRANAVTALAVSPWAPLAAVSGHEQVILYNTQTMDVLGVLPFPEGQPQVIRFSRTGDMLMVGGGRGGAAGTVVVYDVKTGERRIEAGAEYDAVLAADLSPDQSMVVLGGPKKLMRVYSTQSGELLYENKKHTDWVTAAAFSPDGVLVATGDRTNGLVVWEAHSGRIFYELKGHQSAITGLSWRPDSNVLASASEDGTIKLWDMNNGNQIKSWNAHGGGALSVEYTREGQIVSTGRDKVARLWQGDGTKVRDFGGLADIGMQAAYDAESKRVLAGDWLGTIYVWNAEDGAHLGNLTTNPPTLAMQVESLSKQLAAIEAEAKAKSSEAAAIQKAMADKQAAAEKAAAEAAAKAQAATAAQKALEAARAAAKENEQKLAEAAEAKMRAQANAAKNQEEHKKVEAALKAAEAALAEAKAALEKASQGQTAAQTALTAAQKAQESAVAAEKQAQEVYAAAAKAVEQATAAEKAAMEAAAAAKAAAEKAQAEAKPTDDQQKALQQAQQEAAAKQKQAEELKARLEKLKSVQPQTAQAG